MHQANHQPAGHLCPLINLHCHMQENTVKSGQTLTLRKQTTVIEARSPGCPNRVVLTPATTCTVDVRVTQDKAALRCLCCKHSWALEQPQSCLRVLKTGLSTWKNYTGAVQTGLWQTCRFQYFVLGEKKTIFNLWISLSKMVNSEIDVNPLRTDFHPLLFPLFVMWNLHRMSRLCQNLNACANSHLASGLLEKLNPSGMTDQECSVDRTLPPPPPHWLLDGVPLGVRECMNALLGLLELIPAVSWSTTPYSNFNSPAVSHHCISYFCLPFTHTTWGKKRTPLSSPPQLCWCISYGSDTKGEVLLVCRSALHFPIQYVYPLAVNLSHNCMWRCTYLSFFASSWAQLWHWGQRWAVRGHYLLHYSAFR